MAESALDILKKAITLVVVLFLVATIDFLFFQASHDGALLVPRTANIDLRQMAISEHRLDDSLIVQYADYLSHTFTGDFYTSTAYHRGAPVNDFIWRSGANTLFLFGSITLLSMVLASSLTAIWTRKRNSNSGKSIIGLSILSASSAPIAFPMIVLTLSVWMSSSFPIGGPYGIDFAQKDYLGKLADITQHAILPIVSGVLATFGLFTLVFATSMRKTRMTGLGAETGGSRLRGFHNALNHEMPFPRFLIVWSMMSSMAIDIVYNYKGLGSGLWEAISVRDFTFVMALFFIISLMVAVSIFIFDFVAALLRKDQAKLEADAVSTPGASSTSLPLGRVLDLALGIYRRSVSGIIAVIVLVVIAVVALAAPIISTVENPNHISNFEPTHPESDWMNPLPPSLKRSPYTGLLHPLGTDSFGEDIYSLSVYGARHAIATAAVICAVILVVGMLMGILAGLTKGVSGFAAKSLAAVFSVGSSSLLVIPPITLVLALFFGLSLDYWGVLLGLCLVYVMWSWELISRTARSSSNSSPGIDQGNVDWQRAAGAVLHVTKYAVVVCVMTIMFMEFYGLGDPTVISWGHMIEQAYERNAFSWGNWAWAATPFVGTLLLVSSLFVAIHTLEKAIMSAGTRQEDVAVNAQ